MTAADDVTTTANIPDNKMYVPLTSSSSSVFSLPSLCYMTADPQDMMTRNCMSIAKVLKIDLVCPIKRYEKIPRRGSSLCFYESVLGQAIYSQRGISIEPLIEHIKSVFRIDSLPV